jgi:hypothetical protein
MHFYFGLLMQFCSGVDTSTSLIEERAVQVVLMRQLSTGLVCGLAYLATSLSARAAEEYYVIRRTAAPACELTHLPPRTTAIPEAANM